MSFSIRRNKDRKSVRIGINAPVSTHTIPASGLTTAAAASVAASAAPVVIPGRAIVGRVVQEPAPAPEPVVQIVRETVTIRPPRSVMLTQQQVLEFDDQTIATLPINIHEELVKINMALQVEEGYTAEITLVDSTGNLISSSTTNPKPAAGTLFHALDKFRGLGQQETVLELRAKVIPLIDAAELEDGQEPELGDITVLTVEFLIKDLDHE